MKQFFTLMYLGILMHMPAAVFNKVILNNKVTISIKHTRMLFSILIKQHFKMEGDVQYVII